MLEIKPLKQPLSYVANKDQPADYTGGGNAPERVLFINFWFFKYGTNDKAHGAAVILSLLLLFVITLVYFFSPTDNSEKILPWLGNAFLFVAGVAVGKSGGSDENK